MGFHYKYTEKRHTIDMTQNGKFRIGTLYDYRNIEKHGKERGDTEEGKKHIKTNGTPLDSNNESIMPHTLAVARQHIQGNFRIEAEELITIESSDLYLFPTSMEKNKDILEKMNRDYDLGYDSCVIITDGEAFFEALTECIKEQIPSVEGPYYGSCIYLERTQLYINENDYHPALTKEPRYAYQKEHRGIWQPTQLPIQPFNVTCKEAMKYCSAIKLI